MGATGYMSETVVHVRHHAWQVSQHAQGRKSVCTAHWNRACHCMHLVLTPHTLALPACHCVCYPCSKPMTHTEFLEKLA